MEYEKERWSDKSLLDMNGMKKIPWAVKMWEILIDNFSKTFSNWCQIVLKIGENEDVIKDWADTFIKAYEETSQELTTDMERVQNDALLNIEQLLQEFQQLCEMLQTNMPVLGDPTRQLSLCQEQRELKKHIEEYKKCIQERRAEVSKLYEKQSKLCDNLGREPKILTDNPLPSSEEVNELKTYIEELEAEEYNRLEKYSSMREELLRVTSELNVKPSSRFEKSVLSTSDSVFLVTDDNMRRLEFLHGKLMKQQRYVKEEIAQLRNKIEDHWHLLDIDQIEREVFRQEYSGNSLDVLHALQAEIKRCADLKTANLKVLVNKLRRELEQLWDMCHCSQTTQSRFGFFYVDCYTEDLLELHEAEVTKWKEYYKENKELLTLLEKHKCLWNKMLQLEENATGPNRYNNRGGQLLKEEKERNKLSKQIPKIEEMLCDLADEYKHQNDDCFTTYGVTVTDYLANLHEERENERKQKLSARKIQRERNLTPAKSTANLFSSPTQNLKSLNLLSATKRTLAVPLTDEAGKPKGLYEKKKSRMNKTPVTTGKLTSTSSRTKRYSVERKKRLDKKRRLSSQKGKVNGNPNETFSTNYGEFQKTPLAFKSVCGTIKETRYELTKRNDSHSTLIASVAGPSGSLRPITPAKVLISNKNK